MNSFASPAAWIHLDWVLVVVVAWLVIGLAGIVALRRFRFVAVVLFRWVPCFLCSSWRWP